MKKYANFKIVIIVEVILLIVIAAVLYADIFYRKFCGHLSAAVLIVFYHDISAVLAAEEFAYVQTKTEMLLVVVIACTVKRLPCFSYRML